MKKVWKFKEREWLYKRDFILSKINWKEKPDNINEIVKNLNLRFEIAYSLTIILLKLKK